MVSGARGCHIGLRGRARWESLEVVGVAVVDIAVVDVVVVQSAGESRASAAGSGAHRVGGAEAVEQRRWWLILLAAYVQCVAGAGVGEDSVPGRVLTGGQL